MSVGRVTAVGAGVGVGRGVGVADDEGLTDGLGGELTTTATDAAGALGPAAAHAATTSAARPVPNRRIVDAA
jgi:hypothetical protein